MSSGKCRMQRLDPIHLLYSSPYSSPVWQCRPEMGLHPIKLNPSGRLTQVIAFHSVTLPELCCFAKASTCFTPSGGTS